MQFDILEVMEQKIASQRRAIWIIVVGFLLLIALLLYRTSLISGHADNLDQTRTDLLDKVASMRADLRNLRDRNAELLAGRLPGLRQLDFGEIIEKPAEHVESVLITRTNAYEGVRYEYLVIVKNRSAEYLTPEVKILLFNASGYQVGGAKISAKGSSLQRRQALLKPGESRSYTGVLEVNSDEPPPYLLVRATAE